MKLPAIKIELQKCNIAFKWNDKKAILIKTYLENVDAENLTESVINKMKRPNIKIELKKHNIAFNNRDIKPILIQKYVDNFA